MVYSLVNIDLPQACDLVDELIAMGINPTRQAYVIKKGILKMDVAVPDTCDIQWLIQCVNVWGKSLPLRGTYSHFHEIIWRVTHAPHHPDGDRILTFEVHHCDDALWDKEHVESLIQLFQIGLEEKPAVDHQLAEPYPRLLQMYSSLDEVTASFREWLVSFGDLLDYPKPSCNREFHRYMFCCQEHTVLYVQQQLYFAWMKFFLDGKTSRPGKEEDIDWSTRRQLTTRELCMELRAYTQPYSSAHAFAEAYFLWDDYKGRLEFFLPREHCKQTLESSGFCCPMHLTAAGMGIVFSLYAEYFEDIHAITQIRSTKGGAPSILSRAWWEILFYHEGLTRYYYKLDPDWLAKPVDLTRYGLS